MVKEMEYEGMVYRPPSEAYSVIIQATIGCSHNKCTFCTMYKGDKFRIKKTDEIKKDIDDLRSYYLHIRRVFLADGDALIIKTKELKEIIQYINEIIPECERIGIYASPTSVKLKTLEELKELKSIGLDIAYMGLESGNDEVLNKVNKGNTSEEIVEAGKKLRLAGISLSVTVISGLGGKDLWRQHAIDSAKAINEMNPEYLGLLTLMVNPGTSLYDQVQSGQFSILTPIEVAEETLLLIEELDVDNCVFRSNHASNYVSLSGTLNQDREKLIKQLKSALRGEVHFKDDEMRRF